VNSRLLPYFLRVFFEADECRKVRRQHDWLSTLPRRNTLYLTTTACSAKKKRRCVVSGKSARPRVSLLTRPGGSGAAELGGAGLLVPEELGGGSVSGSGVTDLATGVRTTRQDRGARTALIRSACGSPGWSARRAQQHAAIIESAGVRRQVAVLGGFRPGRGWAPGTRR